MRRKQRSQQHVRKKAKAAAALVETIGGQQLSLTDAPSAWPLPNGLWTPILHHLTGAWLSFAAPGILRVSERWRAADLSDPLWGVSDVAQDVASLSLCCKEMWCASAAGVTNAGRLPF